ncbi:MAG: hypothetical protein HLUCCO06_14750, partial [Halomonas sp. HL-93]
SSLRGFRGWLAIIVTVSQAFNGTLPVNHDIDMNAALALCFHRSGPGQCKGMLDH